MQPVPTHGVTHLSQAGNITDNGSAPDSDPALARRIAAGDLSAWQHFFDLYFPWVYRFAHYHLGRNHADAQDLCSDILLSAARSIKGFDHTRGTLDVWLLGVARHRLARFCRRRRLELPLLPEAAVPQAGSDPPLSKNPLDAVLTRDLVNRALSSLPPRQVAVLIGKYISGHSVDELARSTQSSPKAVESLLSRARAAFRAAFRALLDDRSGGRNHD